MTQYHINISGNIEPWHLSMVSDILASRHDKDVRAVVSSLGGDVATALSIYSQFRNHGRVTADLAPGFNASAATLIVMGAARVRMSRQSLFLIHKCSTMQFVWESMNEEQIGQWIVQMQRQQADQQQIDQLIANIYADRTGLPADEITQMMSRSQWHPADECLAKHFVDEVFDGAPVRVTGSVRDQLHYNGSLPDVPDYATQWIADMPADQTIQPSIMNKKFITVQGLCQCEGFENVAGTTSIVVSEQQMQVIDDRLAELCGRVENLGNLESQLAELTAENDRLNNLADKLQQRVDELEEGPGGHTATRVDDEVPATSNYFNRDVSAALLSLI